MALPASTLKPAANGVQLGSATSSGNSNPFSNWAASLFTYLNVPVSASYDFYLAADNRAMAYIESALVVNTSELDAKPFLPDSFA